MHKEKLVRMAVPLKLSFFVVALLVSAQSQAGFSGDLQIDAFLGTAYKVRAGGKGGQIVRSDPVKCNSVGADAVEQTCPNDATYTPSSATGGYQAWGVGIAHINLDVEEVDCFLTLEWVFDWWSLTWGYALIYDCEETAVTFPLGTFGRAVARVKWGGNDLGTSAYWQPPPSTIEPVTSVFAFHNTELADCDPYLDDFTNGGPFNPNRIQARCNNTVDSNYVSDPGYEIEISFDDPKCRAGFLGREHDDTDKDDDCYYYHHWSQESNLPSDYKDTTLFDDQLDFNIGFGSAAAENIIPGFTYEVSQMFQSKVQTAMEGFPVTHSGAITTDVCVDGINFGSDAVCHFAVDTASVGGVPDLFSKVVIPPNW